jgi:hypothetical protein
MSTPRIVDLYLVDAPSRVVVLPKTENFPSRHGVLLIMRWHHEPER